jgi:hypothetical protein
MVDQVANAVVPNAVPPAAINPMGAAPVNPAAIPVAQVETPVAASPTQREDDAIANRDVKGLVNIARDNIGTPTADIAMKVAKGIEERTSKFNSLVKPIDEKGGVATPDGRMEFVKQFQTTADKPQWGNALISYVLGDKKAAVLQVTGGAVSSKVTFDNNGDMILEKVNELGEPVSYTDRKTGRPISEAEYAKRVGGISAWSNTLKGKLEQETRTKSQEAFLKDEESANHWHQLTQNQKQFHAENYDTLSKLKSDLPSGLYNKIIGSVSQSLGQANASSTGKSVFNQIADRVGRGESVTVTDKMAGTLNVPVGTVLRLSGDHLVDTSNKYNVSMDKLKAQTDTENINKEATQNASQTMSSIAEAERLGQLNSIEAAKLRRVIENSQNMGRELAIATEKYGKPSFVSLPTSASFIDKQAQVMAQSLQGMQNADQMDSYIKYRREANAGYKETNTVPLPGEIGTNYLKQEAPKVIRQIYSDEISKVMDKEYAAKRIKAEPTVSATQSKSAAVPAARPSLADLKKKHGG